MLYANPNDFESDVSFSSLRHPENGYLPEDANGPDTDLGRHILGLDDARNGVGRHDFLARGNHDVGIQRDADGFCASLMYVSCVVMLNWFLEVDILLDSPRLPRVGMGRDAPLHREVSPVEVRQAGYVLQSEDPRVRAALSEYIRKMIPMSKDAASIAVLDGCYLEFACGKQGALFAAQSMVGAAPVYPAVTELVDACEMKQRWIADQADFDGLFRQTDHELAAKASAGNVKAAIAMAYKLIISGDEGRRHEGARMLQTLHDAYPNNVLIQRLLGQCLFDGIGCSADKRHGFALLADAAERGDLKTYSWFKRWHEGLNSTEAQGNNVGRIHLPKISPRQKNVLDIAQCLLCHDEYPQAPWLQGEDGLVISDRHISPAFGGKLAESGPTDAADESLPHAEEDMDAASRESALNARLFDVLRETGIVIRRSKPQTADESTPSPGNSVACMTCNEAGGEDRPFSSLPRELDSDGGDRVVGDSNGGDCDDRSFACRGADDRRAAAHSESEKESPVGPGRDRLGGPVKDASDESDGPAHSIAPGSPDAEGDATDGLGMSGTGDGPRHRRGGEDQDFARAVEAFVSSCVGEHAEAKEPVSFAVIQEGGERPDETLASRIDWVYRVTGGDAASDILARYLKVCPSCTIHSETIGGRMCVVVEGSIGTVLVCVR